MGWGGAGDGMLGEGEGGLSVGVNRSVVTGLNSAHAKSTPSKVLQDVFGAREVIPSWLDLRSKNREYETDFRV